MTALPDDRCDVLVIGAGPAGQKAAVQAAKAGRKVIVIERSASVGGECVHRGTIPSKTLRETAVHLSGLTLRTGGAVKVEALGGLTVDALMRRQASVRQAHEQFIEGQLERNGIDVRHARARFLSPSEVEATGVDGSRRRITARAIVIATGSRPRTPPNVPVDHEHILDSDSILSLIYLPATLTVLGAGVIASEYASVFAALGVGVTMIDRGERPLAFLDAEISDHFVRSFEARGGVFLSRSEIESVASDGLTVTTTLKSGQAIRSEKLLCALGRTAQVDGLNVEALGITMTKHGHVAVNENYQTAVPHIYAAGDVNGPPALAATSMEQGRRAARHALGLPVDDQGRFTPVGIYTIPELSCVGLTEREAIEKNGRAAVGRARYRELARGHISGDVDGLLKLVADPDGGRILGVHIIGEGATEIVHLGQMAMMAGMTCDVFVDNIFNFPTLAEAYRVAALDVARQMAQTRPAGARGPSPGPETDQQAA